MKVTIEEYRGFEIIFDTDYEKFQCVIDDTNDKTSKSYNAIKKYIDDYKKDNLNFEAFEVEGIPDNMFAKGELKVIGIRKDKRLVAENVNGEKEQISDYDLSSYMLKLDENQKHIIELKELEYKYKVYLKSYRNKKEQIISNMKIINLKDYKKQIINQ